MYNMSNIINVTLINYTLMSRLPVTHSVQHSGSPQNIFLEIVDKHRITWKSFAGVHAVCNTAHVDLSCQSEGLYYEPSTVTNTLNRFFKKINAEIR